MIYDTFIFFNELELLELRLMIMDKYVDKFVLIEAPYTFTNQKKELFFANNKSKFQKYLHKIIHVIIDNYPMNNDPWENEYFSRNCIANERKKICNNEDIILLSDIDEIPNLKKVNISDIKDNFYVFKQKLYYYYLNCLQAQKWKGTILFKYLLLKDVEMSTIRKKRNKIKNVIDGGWHFSYQGGYEKIVSKMKAYSETQTNTFEFTNKENIQKSLDFGTDHLHRTEKYATKKFVPLDKELPDCVNDFIKKYPYFFKPI